jgi:hypothetical protein
MDGSTFQDPGTAYRGVALWMLNDELEPDEIARQLAGMREAGWGAAITRTFFGLRTPYLGEEWMQVLERIVTLGDNQIEVELVGTLRNLLGPHHRPVGEDWQCWGTDYTLYPHWLDDEGTLAERWTNDYIFLNYGLKGGVVRYLAQR